MEFSTRIIIPKPSYVFSYMDKVLLLGSCFAENVGNRLAGSKLNVDINPFGTLYNPQSVASSLRMLLQPKLFTIDDLFRYEGCYHSFAHHSRFSSPSQTDCLNLINDRLFASSSFLQNTSRLIITFGTAYVYTLKENGQVVANCHKLPEKSFHRNRLSVDDIVVDWKDLLLSLWKQNPELKVLFTVSPIRHWKDGAHANQLSKATLLLAVEQLQAAFPEQTAYFPAYEIMMDELRDYRFYADDMLHPSSLAIDYIWDCFATHFLSVDTRMILHEWNEIRKAIEHRPLQPESDTYRRFIVQTLLKVEHIQKKIPSFDLLKEMEILKSRLK